MKTLGDHKSQLLSSTSLAAKGTTNVMFCERRWGGRRSAGALPIAKSGATHVADDLLRRVDAIREVAVSSGLSGGGSAVGVDAARRRERVNVEREQQLLSTDLHLIRGSPSSVGAREVERTTLENGVVLRLLVVMLLLLPLAVVPRESRSEEREEGNSEDKGLHVNVTRWR